MTAVNWKIESGETMEISVQIDGAKTQICTIKPEEGPLDKWFKISLGDDQ